MAIVVCGFPGIGKTHVFNNASLKVKDSDSSKFKDNFPLSYIEHIKEQKANPNLDFVLVSTHIEVRQALTKANIDFYVVVPSLFCKYKYLERYKERGSPQSFIDLMETNFDDWVISCRSKTPKGRLIVLPKDEYLIYALLRIRNETL